MPRRFRRLLWGVGLCLVVSLGCGDDPTGIDGSDFDGFWDLDLTVGGDACPGDTSGRDCFRIGQNGTDLLVVDDVGGNLTGQVAGNVATLSRTNVAKEVLLTLTMDGSGQRATGVAIETDTVRGCTTTLAVSGVRRGQACGARQTP